MKSRVLPLLSCSLALFVGGHRSQAQTPAQSSAINGVPSWFSHCAGENGQCAITGPTQVIFGTSSGASPAASGHFLTQTVNSSVLCSNAVFGDADPGHAKACWYGPPASLGAGKIVSTGGSDYPFYVQNFESWDDNQRVVVGLYHLAPALVQAQLQQMYQAGMRNVALILWYMPFDNPNSAINAIPTQWPNVWGAYMNSSGGQLSTQAQQNLVAILGLVKQLGFQGVTIRFAPIGATANPQTWGGNWNEAAFQNDEAFTFNTRQLVEQTLAGSTVTRLYDLGIEMAGIPHNLNADGITYADGQTPEWTTRMWGDYARKYGTADSFGFTMAYSSGVLTSAVAEYDQAGIRPKSYAIDLNAPTDLWTYYEELRAAGDTAKPVVIQEISYDDPMQGPALQTELQHVPLTVSYIDQWPVNASGSNTDASPPTNYGPYGGSNITSGTLVIPPCTLQAGQTTCTTTANWSTSNASNVSLLVNGTAAANQSNITTTLTGTTNLTLSLVPSVVQLTSSQGTLVTSGAPVNGGNSAQTVLTAQSVAAIDPTAPSLLLAGLGGASNQAIWALGSNIAGGCTAQLFDPAAGVTSSPLATLTNPNCAPNSISFNIPRSVLVNYSAVQLTLTNPGGHASQPLYIPIQPVPSLSVTGLGDNNLAVWAIGSNISAGCSVQLYDPKSTSGASLASIANINCQPNCLSFLIPSFVSAKYSTVNMTVTNSNGQVSAPVSVQIAHN